MKPLFPTPLFASRVEDLNIATFELEAALSRVDWCSRDDWGVTHLLSTTTFEEDILVDLELTYLESQIHTAVEIHCADLGFSTRKYTRQSWLTRYEPGHYAHTHNHGFSDLSGVYYHTVGDKGGRIFFEDPCLAAHTSRIFPPDRFMIQPERGMILQFPGYLNHGVTRNDSDDVRISLAWNIVFER